MLGSKGKMQAYQHVKANANEGAITLATVRPHEKFVFLGSSCLATVKTEDGLVSCLTVIPKNTQEVVAIAVIAANDPEFLVIETLLLSITTEDSKPFVDLQVPFGGSAKIAGQLIQTRNTCQLRVIVKKEETLLSDLWSSNNLKSSTETSPAKAQGESFTRLCKLLVGIE